MLARYYFLTGFFDCRVCIGRKLNFAPGKIPLGGKSPQKCIYSVPAHETAKHPASSVERRRCSNEAKTRNSLKFARVPKTRQQISAVSGPKFTMLRGHVEEILLFNKFSRLFDINICLSCEDIAGQSCEVVRRWRFFLSNFCVLYFQRAAFNTFQTCILNSH